MFIYHPEEPENIIYLTRTPNSSYYSNPFSLYSQPCSNNYHNNYYNNNYYNNNYYNNNYRNNYHRSNQRQSNYYHDNNRLNDNVNSFYHNNRNNLNRSDSTPKPEKININNTPSNFIDLERLTQRPKKFNKRNNFTTLPKRSTSIPITTPSDSSDRKVETTINKNEASQKISNFLKTSTGNRKTRNILSKLLQLREIQNQLITLESQNYQLELTFSDEQTTSQLLPISTNNRQFLEYEYTILKVIEKLDKIGSDGNELIRKRRKEVIKLAQEILNRLDLEKERQWKKYKMSKEERTEKSINVNENVQVGHSVAKIEE
ncbi:6440_t:CDS:1 [Diversispora eburnea]|uniref:6440_t:CDS:1 n=1 Tax=Diversispora eburnea TaxID=1213867 RepID=A0A9N9FIQ0_9GLOM|nr:6440_t:CDS:1 [Diversispora eburnea]